MELNIEEQRNILEDQGINNPRLQGYLIHTDATVDNWKVHEYTSWVRRRLLDFKKEYDR